jgi:hypothetical protein
MENGQVYRIFRIFLTIEQFFIENDFSRLTTISHFPLLFLRKMSHGSAINETNTNIIKSLFSMIHNHRGSPYFFSE